MQEVEKSSKRSGHGLVTFILCLAFLLIGAGLSYYYLTTYVYSRNNDETSNNKELSTTGVLVNELISRIDYSPCGVNTNLYKKSQTTVDNLDEGYIRTLIAREANGKRVDNEIKFSNEQFAAATNILFGSTYNYTDANITSTCPNIIFDSANQEYRTDSSISCTPESCDGFKRLRYIYKAEQTDSNIYIYVAVALFDEIGKKVYNMNNTNAVIQGVDGNIFDITKDYEKVNKYKYTFNYDSNNNNYIFKSIELQK